MTYRRMTWIIGAATMALIIAGIVFSAHHVALLLWAGAALGSCALVLVSALASREALASAYPRHGYAQMPKRAICGALPAPLAGLAAAFISASFLFTNDTGVASLRLLGAVAGVLAFVAALLGRPAAA